MQSHDTLFLSTYKNSADLMKILFLQQKIFWMLYQVSKEVLLMLFKTAVHTTKSVQGIHGPDLFLP